MSYKFLRHTKFVECAQDRAPDVWGEMVGASRVLAAKQMGLSDGIFVRPTDIVTGWANGSAWLRAVYGTDDSFDYS